MAPSTMPPAEKYLKTAVAGAACASLTHAVLVPLDVVKTRLQVQPGHFPSVGAAFTQIAQKEGLRALSVGFTPTLVGYCVQGAAKFGVYELLKEKAAAALGHEFVSRNSLLVYLCAAGLAEGVATVFLTPFEAIRIRVLSRQVATGEYYTMRQKAAKIYRLEGLNGFYKGLAPILLKQVPYTMVQLAAFTTFVDVAYTSLLPRLAPGKTKADLGPAAQLGITLGCGVTAGVLSAIVSHPQDTILSRINMTKSPEELARDVAEGRDTNLKRIAHIIKNMGFRGLWVGIGLRSVFVGTLSAGMFLIYDSVKLAVGLPTTGGYKS